MKKKVIFIIPSLSGGGAEHMLTILLSRLNRDKISPVLIAYNKKGVYLEQLPSDIVTYDFRCDAYRPGFKWKIPFLFFKTIVVFMKENPDVVITFGNLPNVPTALAKITFFRTIKHIFRVEQTISLLLQSYRSNTPLKRRIWGFFINKADIIVACSNGVGDDLAKNFYSPRNKLKTIYNGIDFDRINSLSQEAVDHQWFKESIPVILSVGRLAGLKNHALLIDAFKELTEHIDCRLVIIGKGPRESLLRALVKELSIEEKVLFLGFQENPYKYMRNSSVFVLPSLYEGFSLVILEAMVSRVPVVSTNCQSGPGEIIENGKSGILIPVNDRAALVSAMRDLLSDREKRRKLIEMGLERAKYFSAEKFNSEFERLILE